MSHWAEIDKNNQVLRVLVGDNSEPDEGYQIIVNAFGGTWIKTSYNGKIRKNYAGIGYTYDESRDAFIPPACHETAALDEKTCRWICNDPSHEIAFL